MRPTTIVIDTSVMVHKLHETIAHASLTKENYLPVIKAQMAWLQSGLWLGSLIEDPDRVQTISCLDSKPYWRTEYLTRPEVYGKIPAKKPTKKNPAKMRSEPVHYKFGRALPEYSFTKLKKTMLDMMVDRGYNMLARPNFEGDDLVAAVVKVNETLDEPHHIIIATVDADQMGLIGENVTWFCTTGYNPRVRSSMTQVNEWALRRLGQTLEKPSDIWDVKTVQGDRSDNLPPGSPIEVISLFEPPDEHKLWLKPDVSTQILGMLNEPQQVSTHRIKAAQEYLMTQGVPRFISPYLG